MPDKGLDLYKTLKADPNYEGVGKDYESFKSFFSDEKNYKNLYNTLKEDPNYEGVGSSPESFADFFGLKKKVQSALPYESFATPFKTTTSTGERISSTDSPSPLNTQINTSPSVSTGKGNNGLSFKPNLNVWDKSPVGSEIKKEDKNADYLRVKQPQMGGEIFVDYESNRTFESLPAVTKVALNKNKELKLASLEYFKQNPQDAAKIQAWQSDKTATGQGVRQEVMQKIYNGVLNEYVPKITEMEKAGVGVQLQNAQKFYGEFNKSIDDLKKAQVKLQFYQNNFLKSKGYEDIVTEGKQLNGKLKEFNIDAWKADSEKILADVNAAKANVEQYVVNGAVPREYQDKYAEAFGQYEYAVNIYNEHNSIPEVQEYNNDIQKLNELNVESEDLLKGFEGSSDYKKAKDDYAAALQRVESMKPQAEEFKQQQPLFNDYIQTAKKVSDLVDKIELANKGFPAPISIEQTRERITKLYDDGYMNEATLRNWAGVLESLPKAVNSIFAGVGSTLSKLTLGQAGDYNVYDKMADYYDGLNKFNTTILPTMKAYKELKDGTTKWDLAALGFQGMQQIGNMAVFATLGGYGKTAMVATGYMMSRKERENEANEAGLTGIQKEAYISTLSTLEGLSELIMPDNQIFTKELKDLILKDAILAQTKGINWFRKQAFKRIAENTGKEILEEWTVSLGELMQKVAVNYDNGNVFDVSKYKDINSWIETAAVTAPLTILGSSYSEINVPKMEMEMARFQAARNLTKSREVLDEMVDTGNMTTEKADAEYKKIVNYAAVQSVMPKDISPAKAVEVSPLIIENKQLEILLESGLDPVFEKQIKDKIKENVTKAEEILSRPEETKQIDDEELELGIAEAELSRPEEEKESGKKFYQGREFMDATGLKPDYYTQEEVEQAKAMKAQGLQYEPNKQNIQDEKANEEPMPEGVQGVRNEGEARQESAELRTNEEEVTPVETVPVEVKPEEIEAGKQEVGSIKEGKVQISNPIILFKGLFGKRNADGTHRTAHAGVQGVFSSLDEKTADRYKGEDGVGTFEIPAGTTVEVVKIENKSVPISEFRKQETEAINASDAQVVKLITVDTKGAEEQYIIKDPALIEKMQKPTESQTEALPTEQESKDKVLERELNKKLSPIAIKIRRLAGLIAHGGDSVISKFDFSKIKGGLRGRYGKGMYFSSLFKAEDYGDKLTYLDSNNLNIMNGNMTISQALNKLVLPSEVKRKIFKLEELLLKARNNKEYNEISEELENLKKVYSRFDKNTEYIEKTLIKEVEKNPNQDFASLMENLEARVIEANKLNAMRAVNGLEDSFNNFLLQSGFDGVNIDDGREILIIPQEKLNNLIVSSQKDYIAEAYQKAKEDGSNPELVEAVEDLLGAKKQAEAKTEIPANIQEIADTVGENPNKVQNIYNKYGDKTKDVSEITQEDYDKAVKAREKSKEKIKLEAIEAKIKQGNLTKLEAKKETNKIEELKKQDSKQVKEVEDFMKLLPDLQKALLESGEIKTIDCKWGK